MSHTISILFNQSRILREQQYQPAHDQLTELPCEKPLKTREWDRIKENGHTRIPYSHTPYHPSSSFRLLFAYVVLGAPIFCWIFILFCHLQSEFRLIILYEYLFFNWCIFLVNFRLCQPMFMPLLCTVKFDRWWAAIFSHRLMDGYVLVFFA